MEISKNSKIVIIISAEASKQEQYAAQELSVHLQKIFGCITRISTDDKEISEMKFVVGNPKRNVYAERLIKGDEFEALVPGPEGMMIQAFGDDTILLAGSSRDAEECDRGTIYAVHEFLERFLGVCFAGYMHPDVSGGIEMPRLEKLSLGEISYIKPKADVAYRTAIVQYGDAQGNPDHDLNLAFLDWLVRNRYNYILTWSGIYDGYKENGMLQEAEKRGIRFSVGHHAASKTFLPPYGNQYFKEHYFETHPEYYKLGVDGKRFVPERWDGQWIFCSRNEELIAEVSQNIIQWIEQNPLVDVIAFWPQDCVADQCVCEKCAQYSKVTNYTYFLNAVAKRVGEVHRHVKIDMLVYVDLWEPPEGLELEPNLIVDEATWHHSGIRRGGIPDGGGIIGTFFEENLLKWHDLGAEVVYYDYYMSVYQCRQRVIPLADELQNLAKRCMEKGIMGIGTQIECYNMWNHIFNYYCFARTLYDAELDMEALLRQFTLIFGKGAKYLAEIMRKLEACYDGQVTIIDAGQYLMTHIDKAEIYELYEKALDIAETAEHRNNIRMMRMAFHYSDLECLESLTQSKISYAPVGKYEDPTGELFFLRQYDSFRDNNPGYGIMIPVDCPETNKFVPDRWYDFEKNC